MTNFFEGLGSPLYLRSSLYGASLVASEFQDSNIVVWGPRGCTSQVLEAMNLQRQQFDYYHYLVSEADIVFDGMSVLKRDLISMIEGYISEGPLFLFLGDATQLTSEHIEGFIENRIPKKFPIIFVETGFRGDCYNGINETIYKLFKRFCTKGKKKRNLINLIPEVGISPQWRGDADELSRILNKLGFEVNIVCNRSKIEDIAKITEASYTILLNPQIGKKAAEFLQEKFEIPLFTPPNMPIGLLGTELWLKEVINFTGKDIPNINDIIEHEKETYFLKMRPGLREENYNTKVNIIRASKFLICDELNKALQWSRLLINELKFDGGYIYPTVRFDENDEDKDIPFNIELIKDIDFLISCYNKENVALILGSDWINEIVQKKVDKLVCINNPTIKRITFISKPYYGFTGSLYLLEDVLNCINY